MQEYFPTFAHFSPLRLYYTPCLEKNQQGGVLQMWVYRVIFWTVVSYSFRIGYNVVTTGDKYYNTCNPSVLTPRRVPAVMPPDLVYIITQYIV